MKRVAILTPAYGGMIHTQHAQSVMAASNHLEQHDIGLGWISYGNIASVTKARNALISEAIDTGYDEAVFIDSDIAFHPSALHRLLKHDVDLVGASQKGNMREDFPFALQPLVNDEGQQYFSATDGIAEVAAMPTAFLRMRLPAVRALMDERPDLQYYDERVKGCENHLYALFDYRLTPHPSQPGRQKYQGEDYSFCQLWRESGRRVYCDLTIPLRHIKTVNLDGAAIDALQPRDAP
jgi:hypothetical protein